MFFNSVFFVVFVIARFFSLRKCISSFESNVSFIYFLNEAKQIDFLQKNYVSIRIIAFFLAFIFTLSTFNYMKKRKKAVNSDKQ